MSMNNNSMKFLQLAAGAASLTALSGCTKDSSSTDCPAGKVPFGKQCVDKCAANKTFASETNSTCVDQCPEGKTFASATNTTCVDKKPELKKCPEKEHFDAEQKICVKDDDAKKCSEKQPCPEGQVCTDNKCVPDTPQGAGDCGKTWGAVQAFVGAAATGDKDTEVNAGLTLWQNYQQCTTCLTSAIHDPTQKQIVEDVTGEIDILVKRPAGVTVEAVVDKFTNLFKQFGKELNEGQQRAARHAVYEASLKCNGPDGEAFRGWAHEKNTHTALVEKAHVSEADYQDLLNNLD